MPLVAEFVTTSAREPAGQDGFFWHQCPRPSCGAWNKYAAVAPDPAESRALPFLSEHMDSTELRSAIATIEGQLATFRERAEAITAERTAAQRAIGAASIDGDATGASAARKQLAALRDEEEAAAQAVALLEQRHATALQQLERVRFTEAETAFVAARDVLGSRLAALDAAVTAFGREQGRPMLEAVEAALSAANHAFSAYEGQRAAHGGTHYTPPASSAWSQRPDLRETVEQLVKYANRETPGAQSAQLQRDQRARDAARADAVEAGRALHREHMHRTAVLNGQVPATREEKQRIRDEIAAEAQAAKEQRVSA